VSLQIGVIALLFGGLLSPTGGCAFALEDVAARAERLAGAAYQKPGSSLSKALKTLTYDQYRDIRFRPEWAWWRGAQLPFEVTLFHRGFFYEEPVAIREITPEGERDIVFDPDRFDYGKNKLDRDDLPKRGFAGPDPSRPGFVGCGKPRRSETIMHRPRPALRRVARTRRPT
jgi:glucans biosynthesis protein